MSTLSNSETVNPCIVRLLSWVTSSTCCWNGMPCKQLGRSFHIYSRRLMPCSSIYNRMTCVLCACYISACLKLHGALPEGPSQASWAGMVNNLLSHSCSEQIRTCMLETGLLMICNHSKAATQDGPPCRRVGSAVQCSVAVAVGPKGVTFAFLSIGRRALTEAKENRQQYQLVLHPHSTTLRLGDSASLLFKRKTDSQTGTAS